MGAGAAADSSTAVMVMDVRIREWMVLPHPFRQQLSSFRVLCGPPGVSPTLPAFPKVSAAVSKSLNLDSYPDGSDSKSLAEGLLLLTPGDNSLHLNGKDLVPKYRVSLLVPPSASSTGFRWYPDMPTLDKSGYCASLSQVAAVSVANMCILIGSSCGIAMTVGDDGRVQPNFPHHNQIAGAVVDVLTSKGEWYRPEILNTDLLVLASTGRGHAVYDAASDCVWLLSLTAEATSLLQIQAHCLYRASALSSMLKPAKASAKTAPSSQLDRLQRHEARPLRSCAQCGAMETRADGFKRCGGCRKPVYCGAECQRLHWRAGHKIQCKTAQDIHQPGSA
jgi:hypothetical protein